jgi:hypothetical protein
MWSKTGLTTLIFSRGYVFPYHRPLTFGQLRQESESGLVRVVTPRPRIRHLLWVMQQLPVADFVLTEAWLIHTLINGSASTFTATDHASTAYTVRWWPEDAEGIFDGPEIANGLVSVTLPLRVEV